MYISFGAGYYYFIYLFVLVRGMECPLSMLKGQKDASLNMKLPFKYSSQLYME